MNRILALATLSVAWFAFFSCNSFEARACTEMGCSNGLSVELEGTPTAPFTLTATAAGRTESIVCEEARGCQLFFEDFTPSQVTISYRSGAEDVEETFSPNYKASRPNGEDCPPECLNATVALELPL